MAIEKETEVKLLNINIVDFEQKLKDIGSKFIKIENQKNITINSTTHKIYKELGYLRIRTIKEKDREINYCTFKENISNTSARNNIEHTIEFDDVKELINIFKLLGYDKFHIGYKERKKYNYKDITIDIDQWDKDTYPYPYVEVEAKTEEDIYNFVKELEIDKSHISTLSIAELIKNYKNE